MKIHHFPKEFFAGILSGNGFTNLLPAYTKDVQSLYIIKGTPGSGKSTLMRKIAQGAEAAGEAVELIRCSSDPSSLDGVIIPALSLAMVDGTAPHVTEPLYPIARETVINTADYLDEEKILTKKDEVIHLTLEKKKCFEHAEKLLKCSNIIESEIFSIAQAGYDEEKAKNFCNKATESEHQTAAVQNATQKTFALVAFGKNGFKTLFGSLTINKLYKINRVFSSKVLNELKKQATEKNISAVFSPSPFDAEKLSAVYFCNSATLFVDSRFAPDCQNAEKIKIPTFEKPNGLGNKKEKLKFLKKTQNLILDECQATLSEGMTFHAKLEEIYSSSMNKNALDCLAQSLIVKLFE